MGDYLLNTIFVTCVSLFLVLVFALPTAYVLARFKFKFRNMIKKIFVMGLFLQSTIYLVPLFLLLNEFNFLDNRIVLCFVYAITSFPFTIYLLTGFMKGFHSSMKKQLKLMAVDILKYY